MISRIFIDRPRLSVVISLVILLVGGLALRFLPVQEFPTVTPPEVSVVATYPGASSDAIQDAVAAPVESAVNGVEDMIYMSSTSANDGTYRLSVTFAPGTDPDIAQVNVQNRVQLALSRVPEEVRRQGVEVRKRSPSLFLVVHVTAPGGELDRLALSNWTTTNVVDVLSRLDGVGEASIFGPRDYAMRVWMDPKRMASLDITAEEIAAKIRAQNIQPAAGQIGAPPHGTGQVAQFNVQARDRLETPEQFGDIIIRTGPEGAVVRLRDIARVELGAQTYGSTVKLNGVPDAAVGLFLTPGANALETKQRVIETMDAMKGRFPAGVEYTLTYDTTAFISAAIREAIETIFITVVLVVLVTFLFLQDWRQTLIPTLAIPVSLLGTLAVLFAAGMSANTQTIFALILAIGLVVDDAIVVIENVQRIMSERGLGPRDAAVEAMRQVSGPVVATSLVLLAVFAPVVFLPGIRGALFRQFGITISVAVIISTVVALTLSPALAALLLRPVSADRPRLFRWFERGVGRWRRGFLHLVRVTMRRTIFVLAPVAAAAIVAVTLYPTLPTGFLPSEDRGLVFAEVQLPDATAYSRTEATIDRIAAEIRAEEPGVLYTVAIAGRSIVSGTNASNIGFIPLDLHAQDERPRDDQAANAIVTRLRARFAGDPEAEVRVFNPPPIRGLGVAGGFDLRLQSVGTRSPEDLSRLAEELIEDANADPRLQNVSTTYRPHAPQLYVDIDRLRAESLGVDVGELYAVLQAQLGSQYVNDFNRGARVYQVRLQADTEFRGAHRDIEGLYVRSRTGDVVRLGAVASVEHRAAPEYVQRYNMFPTIPIQGEPAPGVSTGEAMDAMAEIAGRRLGPDFAYEWSGTSLQEQEAGAGAGFAFLLAGVFGYLILVGLYESFTSPLAVMLSGLFGVLGTVVALASTGADVNVYVQIGLVLVIALSAKNAILIVEFSAQQRELGASAAEAALEGARARFRAVLMTALSFVVALVPLLVATGAGAGSRRALGLAVFGGMSVASFVGVVFVPGLYYVFETLRERIRRPRAPAPTAPASTVDTRATLPPERAG